jgi:hypothetical protein
MIVASSVAPDEKFYAKISNPVLDRPITEIEVIANPPFADISVKPINGASVKLSGMA